MRCLRLTESTTETTELFQERGLALALTEADMLSYVGLKRTFYSHLLDPTRCSSCCGVIRKGDVIVRGQYVTYPSVGSFCDDCVDRALEIFYAGCEPCTIGTAAMAAVNDPMARDSVNIFDPSRHNYDNLFLGDYLRP